MKGINEYLNDPSMKLTAWQAERLYYDMTKYATDVAENTLKDAAENAKLLIETRWPKPDRIQIDRAAILNTPIKTP